MSFEAPEGGRGGPGNRLIAGAAALALAVVIAAVVVIVTQSSGSRSTRTSAAGTASTGPATVTAPHILSTTTAVPTPSTATGSSGASTSNTALAPAGGPLPSGFEPGSFTAISDSTWWLMGDARCGSPPCTSIVRSADAGRSWVGIPAPRTSEVTDLRFADARDGFAFGQQLWSTHDGGEHWRRLRVTGAVRDLSISGGYVYVGTTDGLMRAGVSGDDLSVVHAGDIASVWAQGRQLLADEITSGGNALLSSTDSGTSFAARPAPEATVECHFATTGGADFWAQCATGTEGGVWHSVNAGTSWSAVSPPNSEDEPNGAALAAASGSSAVSGYNQVFHTTDGGAQWSKVSGLGAADTAVSYLGFSDAEHGVAIVMSEAGESSARLEVTTDGGASYSPVNIRGR